MVHYMIFNISLTSISKGAASIDISLMAVGWMGTKFDTDQRLIICFLLVLAVISVVLAVPVPGKHLCTDIERRPGAQLMLTKCLLDRVVPVQNHHQGARYIDTDNIAISVDVWLKY